MKTKTRAARFENYDDQLVLCEKHAQVIWREQHNRDCWYKVDTADLIQYEAVIGVEMPCAHCKTRRGRSKRS